MTSNELSNVASLWAELFKDDDIALVKVAVANLLQTLEFPPTIADVKKEISKLVSVATNEDTAIEEWNAIRGAIKNSIYYSVELFERLPDIAKMFVGSPSQLKSWAMSEDFNEGVVRGQFLKQYEVLKERKRYKAMLTPKLEELLVSASKGAKLIEAGEVNGNG